MIFPTLPQNLHFGLGVVDTSLNTIISAFNTSVLCIKKKKMGDK